jgi:hypothetical protein
MHDLLDNRVSSGSSPFNRKPNDKVVQQAFIKAGQMATATHQQRHNQALHPTASVPLVPRSTPAAGELGRSAAARSLAACVIIELCTTRRKKPAIAVSSQQC